MMRCCGILFYMAADLQQLQVEFGGLSSLLAESQAEAEVDVYSQMSFEAQDKVVRSLARQTAAGDVSAVFAYMKVLDPGSVVREVDAIGTIAMLCIVL